MVTTGSTTGTYNYSNSCSYRLPCGICTRTNGYCPINPCMGTAQPIWGYGVTPMPTYEYSTVTLTTPGTSTIKVEDLEKKTQEQKDKRKVEREFSAEKYQEFLESLNDIPEPSKYDNHDIRNLPVMKSVTNPLRKAGIMSIGELCQKTAKELLDIPRISKGRVKEIEEALSAFGLKLKG